MDDTKSFDELDEERYKIEKEMVELAEDYLFDSDMQDSLKNNALWLIIKYNYVIRKLQEIGGWY